MAKYNEGEFEAFYASENNVTEKEANQDINAFKRVMKSIANSGNGVGFWGVGAFRIATVKGRAWNVNGQSGVSEDSLTLKFKVSDVLRKSMNTDESEN